ncbi:hypothetical protein [Streptomyces sp. NPDC090025]|uniref:hypothetical protein n=1 Tax=Streptomyces sp. NPDC090025 TaxID=3365922 RepID=UPI003839083D
MAGVKEAERREKAPQPVRNAGAADRVNETAGGTAGTPTIGPDQLAELGGVAGNRAVEGHLARGGGPLGPVQSLTTASLDARYRAALATARTTGEWGRVAELLNGFSPDDIKLRLSALTPEEIGYLRGAALGHVGVGPDSQLARLTAPDGKDGKDGGQDGKTGSTQESSSGERRELGLAAMTGWQRVALAYERASVLNSAIAQLRSMITPEALAKAIIAFAVTTLALALTPVGWTAGIVLGLTALFLASSVLKATNHLIGFAAARNATTEPEIDAAAKEFGDGVAALGIDAIMFLVFRRATRGLGGPGAGAAPPPGPPAPGMVMLGIGGGGEAVAVAAETIPATVVRGAQLGGAATLGYLEARGRGGGGGQDPRYKETNRDRRKQLEPDQRKQRISDGSKLELEDSPQLRARMPAAQRRRAFMNWLLKNHEAAYVHEHVRPGSRLMYRFAEQFEAEELGIGQDYDPDTSFDGEN